MLRVYSLGFFILIAALLANFFASKLQLKTWYDLVYGLLRSCRYWEVLKIKDLLWLFILYPLFLGFGAVLGNFIYSKLFSS